MIKIIVSLVMLFNSNFNVKIVDYYTNEELVGVKVNSVYTDFEGKVNVKTNQLNIFYPSYESLDTIVYSKDNIIKIKQLN